MFAHVLLDIVNDMRLLDQQKSVGGESRSGSASMKPYGVYAFTIIDPPAQGLLARVRNESVKTVAYELSIGGRV